MVVWMAWLLLPAAVRAQKPITLPPYHWAREYALEWQLRRPIDSLFVGSQPWQFSQLQPLLATRTDDAYLRFLQQRLRQDATHFGVRDGRRLGYPHLQLGGRVVERAGRLADETRSRLAFRFTTGVAVSERLHIVNTINLDQNLADDPEYLGKNWRGLTAITEQAYGLLHLGHILVKFGRDYIRWGRGEDATLTVSDASRPFDQLWLQYRTRRAQFTWFASKLNTVSLSPEWQAKLQAPWAERYMVGGRAELALLDQRLQIAASQLVVWAGRDPEWYFLNPFIMYYSELANEPDSLRGNILGAIDVVYYPRPGLELYGTLMIDDIQVERTGPGDLEPNEIGWMAGMRLADPLGLSGATLGIEYTRVANRTYNTLPEAERFVHRNKPIGHFLGNDFDRWLLMARKYLGGGWLLTLHADFRRHGEGRVNVPFDRPWMNASLEEGYSEPFPSGVVERSQIYTVDLRWHPRAALFVSLSARWHQADNYQNVAGERLERLEVFLNLWWDVQWFLPL